MPLEDFKTCKITLEDDGFYKCVVERNNITLARYARTEEEAFNEMCELIDYLDNFKEWTI